MHCCTGSKKDSMEIANFVWFLPFNGDYVKNKISWNSSSNWLLVSGAQNWCSVNICLSQFIFAICTNNPFSTRVSRQFSQFLLIILCTITDNNLLHTNRTKHICIQIYACRKNTTRVWAAVIYYDVLESCTEYKMNTRASCSRKIMASILFGLLICE